MNIDETKQLSQPDEPSNDELREIEEHLDDYDYFEDQAQPIIIFTTNKISNTFIMKSAFKSD